MRTLGQYQAEYDGAVRKLDEQLGRLFDELRRSGRLERTTVCVVSTHGFGFGEAGLLLDNGTLADCDLRVPLILRPRGELASVRGASSPSLASLADVAPTLLAIEGLPRPSEMQGVSLRDCLDDPAAPTRPFAFAGSGYQEGECVLGPRHCYELTRPWLALEPDLVLSWYGGRTAGGRAPREVLHDRERDPSVGHARSAALDPAVVEPMREAARRWREEVQLLRGRYHPRDWPELER
jgi:arylsulfatase A-like enzyme